MIYNIKENLNNLCAKEVSWGNMSTPRKDEGEDKLAEAANRLADYLHVLLAVEYDVDVIDRLAKSRQVDEFKENMYNALRRKLTLESKLNELEKKGGQEDVRRALSIIKSLNPSHVESLAKIEQNQLKGLATYVGARALASTVLFDNLRRLAETR